MVVSAKEQSLNSRGKTVGIVLTAAGLVLAVALGLWLYFGNQEGTINASGAAFGAALFSGVLILPLVGAGVFLIKKGSDEEADLARVREQRKLLDMVKTRGQVAISDLVLELNATTDKVKNDIYDLVGRGLFTGYVDWDGGTLYSVEASALSGQKNCPNCGGQLELGGKGIIKCPYCGSEIFL